MKVNRSGIVSKPNQAREMNTKIYIPEVQLLAGNLGLVVVNPNLVVRALIGITRQAHHTGVTTTTQERHSN
jgi:hypothetical protein